MATTASCGLAGASGNSPRAGHQEQREVSQMVESRSMVNGPSPGPAPAAQARASSSRLTRSSWRTWPTSPWRCWRRRIWKLQERPQGGWRLDYAADGASRPAVHPVRSTSASSMQSPPAYSPHAESGRHERCWRGPCAAGPSASPVPSDSLAWSPAPAQISQRGHPISGGRTRVRLDAADASSTCWATRVHLPGSGATWWSEFTQTQVLGEGDREEQPGIGHQAVVVEGDLNAVGMVKW